MTKFVEELIKQEPFASLIVQEPPRSDEELVKYASSFSTELNDSFSPSFW